jgi:hypothetical protein
MNYVIYSMRNPGITCGSWRMGHVNGSSTQIIQDELETVPLCPNLSINERNLAFMWICGNSRMQLEEIDIRETPVVGASSPLIVVRAYSHWIKGHFAGLLLDSSNPTFESFSG